MKRSTALLRKTLVGLGAIVAVQAALGFAGVLSRAATTALLVALGAWIGGHVARSLRAGGWRRALFTDGSSLEAALLVALTAALALRLWFGRDKTSFLYDTLSFHLHFPASWMHAGRLVVVPAVFGDVAPAYNPSNAELLFHLLMAPLRSDYLAGVGQIPFAALACLAIHATVREAGGSRGAGLAAALGFLLVPEVWQQARTAMVDVAVAGLFLSTLPWIVRLWRRPGVPDARALALAFGLFVGTKFVAVPLSAPLAAAALALAWRHRAALVGSIRATAVHGAAFAAIIVASGGFWYLRNLIVAGNPIYPLALNIGGLALLPGVVDASAMRSWDYHVPVSRVGDLVGTLLFAGMGFSGMGLAAVVVRLRARAFRAPDVLLGVALLALVWLVVPYQHSRFFFPFFGALAVTIGIAASHAVPATRVMLLAVVSAGGLLEWPTAERLAVAAAGAVGAFLPAVERALARYRLSLRAPAVALLAAFAASVAHGAGAYRARFPGYSIGDDDFDRAWTWLYANVRGGRVAYAGVNLPFPLAGRDLANRVSYVNVALGPGARLHDFHRHASRAGGAPIVASAEPAPYRDGARFDVWRSNLRAEHIDTLFVSVLYPIVARAIDHDADGFPVERAWADAHRDIFSLRYATASVRIYSVRP